MYSFIYVYMSWSFEIQKLQKEMQEDVDELRQETFPRANFALESNGAEIITTFETKTIEDCGVLGLFCATPHPPRNLIKGKVEQGDCWHFEGSEGKVLIKLSEPVVIQSVGVLQLSERGSTNGAASAPKAFKVFVSDFYFCLIKSTRLEICIF